MNPLADDLTTLANVKASLRLTATTDDALLQSILSGASRFYQREMQRRPFLAQVWTETYSGQNKPRLFLRQDPVLSVSAVSVNGVAQLPSTGPTAPGFTWDQWSVYLRGGLFLGASLNAGLFLDGFNNCTITYVGGYGVVESVTVPGIPYQYTVLNNTTIVRDLGVVYAATGLALTAVSGTLAKGQYSVSAGVYTFAAADAGAAVTITYAYLPVDLEQAVIETTIDRYRTLDRMGQTAKILAGENVTFSIKDLQPWNQAVVETYRRRVYV